MEIIVRIFCYDEKFLLRRERRIECSRRGDEERIKSWEDGKLGETNDAYIIRQRDNSTQRYRLAYEFPFPTLRQTLRATRYFYILYPIKPAKSINILTGIFKQHSPSSSPSSFSMHAAYRPFSSISQSQTITREDYEIELKKLWKSVPNCSILR